MIKHQKGFGTVILLAVLGFVVIVLLAGTQVYKHKYANNRLVISPTDTQLGLFAHTDVKKNFANRYEIVIVADNINKNVSSLSSNAQGTTSSISVELDARIVKSTNEKLEFKVKASEKLLTCGPTELCLPNKSARTMVEVPRKIIDHNRNFSIDLALNLGGHVKNYSLVRKDYVLSLEYKNSTIAAVPLYPDGVTGIEVNRGQSTENCTEMGVGQLENRIEAAGFQLASKKYPGIEQARSKTEEVLIIVKANQDFLDTISPIDSSGCIIKVGLPKLDPLPIL